MHTIAICTVRVQFSSGITSGNVYLGQIADTSDLDEIRSLDKMSAANRPVRNQPSAIAALETPCDFDTLFKIMVRLCADLPTAAHTHLSVSDIRPRTGFRGRPYTEIVNRVD